MVLPTLPRRRARLPRALKLPWLSLLGLLACLLVHPAPAAAADVARAEAESGTLDGWYMRAVADPAASGGTAVRYDWAGSVKLTVSLPADADTVTLRVRGDQCAGAPAYTLSVDNAQVGDGTVPETAWADRAYTLSLPAGTHTVEVRYTNDYTQFWPACDRNLYLDAVTFSASGAASAPRTTVPAGFVHQDGTRLLDGANRPLRLRGVDLGGWLLWEGWLWGQGFDYIGESAMMRNLASLVGQPAADQFRADVRDNYVTGADLKAIASYGLNVVRVPFNYRLLEDDANPGVYKQSGWDVLDRLVAEARANGVYVVLDMHAAPCSQMYAFVSDYVGPDYLWSSAACQNRMIAMWKAIAARYANEGIVAGYDLLGETIVGDAQLRDLYQRVTAAIRQVDRNHLIIYEGNYMARTFDLFTAPLDSNEMLSFHDYPWAFPGEDLSVRMAGYDAAARRLNAPQWAGEFGQSTYADIDKYVRTFNADPLMAGWAQWTWKQSPGFAALQTIQHTAASQKLIYWMNDPTRPRPTAAEAAQGMSDFIRAIRFENTVPDAKMRSILTQPAPEQPAPKSVGPVTPVPTPTPTAPAPAAPSAPATAVTPVAPAPAAPRVAPKPAKTAAGRRAAAKRAAAKRAAAKRAAARRRLRNLARCRREMVRRTARATRARRALAPPRCGRAAKRRR